MTDRKTKATRAKLEQVLDILDSFLGSSNVGDVIDDREIARLNNGRSEIAEVESRLWSTEKHGDD